MSGLDAVLSALLALLVLKIHILFYLGMVRLLVRYVRKR